MTSSNKRSLADAGLNPFPSCNKARKTQFAAPLPPASENASRSSQPLSPPTLVGSVSNSPPRQPYTSSSPSVSSSDNTSSSNASSLDQPCPHPLTDWTSSSSTHGTESVSPSDASTLDQPSPPGQHYSSCSSTHGTESVSPSDASTLDQPSDKPKSSNSKPGTRPHLATQNRLPGTSSTSTSDTDTTSSGTTTSEEASESSSYNPDNSSDSSSEPSHNSNAPSTNPRATTSTLTAQNLSNLPLLNRLDSLLPKLQSANEQLEVEKREGRLGERDIENVKEEDGEEGGEGYIEMDLGLGVLEEKKKKRREGKRRAEEVKRERVSISGSGSGSGSEGFDGGEKTAAGGKEDALATMMGISRLKGKRKVKIEEV